MDTHNFQPLDPDEFYRNKRRLADTYVERTASDERGDTRFNVKNSRGESGRRCGQRTRKGERCRMWAQRDSGLCINHDPRNDVTKSAVRASRAAAEARQDPIRMLETVFSFADRASIQAALDVITRLQLAGRISDQRAMTALRACSIASRNFDRATETLTGPRPQLHEWQSYFEKVSALLDSVEPLLVQHPDEFADDDSEDFPAIEDAP